MSKTVELSASKQVFAFSPDNLKRAQEIIAKYPKGKQRSALLPLLDIAQRQNGGWLPRHVLDYIGDFLELPHIKVYEVATFYTMFNLQPVGKNLIQVCRTTPCWLRGADKLTEACKKNLGIGKGQMTANGEFSLVEVECLGACVNAPMVQINDDYYEDLTPDKMESLLNDLKAGKKITPGTQVKRLNSAPEPGLTTLKNTSAETI